MAQAPEGGISSASAPRQNKTVKQFNGMNTQNRRNAIPEGSFGWLENIQPIGPGHLHSIPGRGLSLTRIPPIVPNTCPDSAPGPQDLSVVCCYDSYSWGDLGGNNCGMFAHADDDGDFWHTASLNSGFSSGPYPIATPDQTWYLLEPVSPGDQSSPFDCSLQETTATALPGGRSALFQSTQTPQGGTCGKSDEKCYALFLTAVDPPVILNGSSRTSLNLYVGADSGVSFLQFLVPPSGPFPFDFIGIMGDTWCKFDDHLYCPSAEFAFGPLCLASFPIPSPNGSVQDAQSAMGLVLDGWDDGTMNSQNITMIHATPLYLYILAHAPWSGGPTTTRIFRVNRATMTYITHWTLTGDSNFPAPWGLHVFNDELIFLIQDGHSGNPWKIGNFHTSSGLTDVIGTCPQSCTAAGHPVGPSGQSGFYYAKNYFYLSYSGYGFGTTNVVKIGPLVCPSDPDLPFQS